MHLRIARRLHPALARRSRWRRSGRRSPPGRGAERGARGCTTPARRSGARARRPLPRRQAQGRADALPEVGGARRHRARRPKRSDDAAAARRRTIPSCAEPHNNLAAIYAAARRLRQGARRAGRSDPPQPELRDRAREPRRRVCAARGRRPMRGRSGSSRRTPRLPRKLALVRQLPSRRRAGRAASAAARPPSTVADTATPLHETLTWRPRCKTFAAPLAGRAAPPLRSRASGAGARAEGQARHLGRRHRRRARRRQGAEDGRQLRPVREGRPLRRHDLPPRHRQLHDPGRRHDRRHEGKADPRADPRSRAATA